jgi:hypothetical protein
LQDPERKAYVAEMDAWAASPEGIATLAAERAEKVAAERARYEAALPAAIEKLLRNGNHYDGDTLGLPPRALDLVLAGLADTPALTAVRGATDICILGGAPGTGKSVAAVAWVHEYVARPENWAPSDGGSGLPTFHSAPPLWVSGPQLARISHFDQAEVNRIAKARRLVIDDLGSEYHDAKGFFQTLLDEIIDVRYAGKLPTVITTNLDAAGFAAWYGERIVDRVREGGRFIACGNASLRRR